MSRHRRTVAGVTVSSVLATVIVSVYTAPTVHAAPPAAGVITTYAGGGTGQGKATTVGQSTQALGIFGSTLYIADQSRGVVHAVNLTNGMETTAAGNGQPGSSGDGGPATAAAIGVAWSLAVNPSGDLFIGTGTTVNNDPSNLIRRVDHATGVITTVAGGGTSYQDGVAATATSLSEIQGLAFNAAGDLFVSDYANDRVRKIDHTTGVITTFAGTGAFGYNGDGIPATSAKLSYPSGVTVDSAGDVLFSDYSGQRIRQVDHTTGNISTVAGNGNGSLVSACPTGSATGPASTSSLFFPVGVSLDPSGNLIIADQAASCVTSVVSGSYSTIAGNGSMGVSGDGGPATSAAVGIPVDAVSDGAGNIYISQRDNNVVRRVDHTTHVITTYAGTGQTCGWSGDGGPATQADFCTPSTVALDAAGDLFIADNSMNVIRKVDTSGIITTVAGNGVQGFSGDGGPANAAQIWGPGGLAVDSGGNLFISDSGNHRIRKVDTSGKITTFAGSGSAVSSGNGGPALSAGIASPEGLLFDGAGDLILSDGGAIREVNPAGVISAHPAAADPRFGGEFIALDSAGNLYASSVGGVWKATPGNVVTQLTTTRAAGVGIGPQGQVVFAGNTNYVDALTAAGTITLAGNGVAGFSGDGGPSINATVNWVVGLGVDPAGDIFVADYGNHRVRRIQAFTAPSSPLSVNATLSGTQANVAWSAPVTNGGLPVTAYYVTTHSPGAPDRAPVQVASTSTVVGGLAYHTTYSFTVSAANGWATSADSAPSASVMSLPADGDIATYAGRPASGSATAIGQAPFSLAIEGSSVVLIGDGSNPVVRSVDTVAGQETVVGGNGAFGYSGDGGDSTAAAMNTATALAECGPAGPVYAADYNNFRIRQMRGVATTVAGTGINGDGGDGGPATSAQIGNVFGLACSATAGRTLYIADSTNGTVRFLGTDGNIHGLWTGFSFPTGIVELNPNVIEVVDSGTNVVWRLNDASNTGCVVAGIGPAGFNCSTGTADTTALALPIGISWDGSVTYFAEENGNRVRGVDSAGRIFTVAGTGAAGFGGDGGSATAAVLNHPTGVVFAGNTNTLYIADAENLRVRAVNSGLISTVAGNGSPSFYGNGVNATDAQFGFPYGVAADAAGDEFLVDGIDNAIRKIDASGVITTLAGQPTLAPGFGGDGGLATGARLNNPLGVAIDAQGNVYLSDSGNQRVREVIHSSGLISTVAGDGSSAILNSPSAVAVDSAGAVYIADTGNNRIRRLDPITHVLSTIAGTGTAGFGGDGGPAASAVLSHPGGVVVSASGDVFISDTGNQRVRRIDHATGKISTLAGNGAAGEAGDDRPAVLAQLSTPLGLAIDAGGDLLVADSGNHRVRIIDVGSATPTIRTLAGTCGGAFSGDGGPAAMAHLDFPTAVAADGLGNVLVADVNNNRVRGVRGGSPARSMACQTSSSSAASRGANQSPPVTAPPLPRISARGLRIDVAALRATSAIHVSGPPVLGGVQMPSPAKQQAVNSAASAPPATSSAVEKPVSRKPVSYPHAESGNAAAYPGARATTAHVTDRVAPDSPLSPLAALVLVPVTLLALWAWRRRSTRPGGRAPD